MFLYTGIPDAVTPTNDCESLSEVKLDSLSQIFYLFDAYYIKVLESKCHLGILRVCVLKDLSTNSSIIFQPAPAADSPLCDHRQKPNCLPSLCYYYKFYNLLDSWLGLSLILPNHTNSYLILNMEADEVYQKDMIDQPRLLRDVWLEMIPECHALVPLGLTCLVLSYLLMVVCAFIALPVYAVWVCQQCKR